MLHTPAGPGQTLLAAAGASPAHLVAFDQLCRVVPAVQLDCFLSQIVNTQMAQHIQVAQQSVHLRGIGLQRQNCVSGTLQGHVTLQGPGCQAVCHADDGGKYAS